MAHSTNLPPIEAAPFYVDDLLQMARAVNYRRWQFEIVAPFVTGTVLEVGGGIGNFTPALARAASTVISIEPNEYCHRQLVENTRNLPNVSVYRSTIEDLDKHVPVARHVDTVLMMNVLEHIKDDAAVLVRLRQQLKPTGRIVVLVPAGQWAFGVIDERLGHCRRYSKGYARKLMSGVKLEIEKMRYYNFIGVWAWWWNARFTRKESQNAAQIALFDRLLVPIISRVEKIVPPPVGQSLLIVARPVASSGTRT